MDITEKSTDYEVIICTCEKFSDLWEPNISFLNKNWRERGKTFLATDLPTKRNFENIEIVFAGEGAEITERLQKVLENVNSEYVLLLLDDYFLTEPVENAKIKKALEFMAEEDIDYLRLYGASKIYLKKEGAKESVKHKGFFLRNISEGTYKISLYPGIWKTDFMRATLEKSLNPWQYEVFLTEAARKYGAKCAISNNGELPFLDVIRKGKILRKAKRRLENEPLFVSERETMSFKDEFILDLRTALRRFLPKPLFLKLKGAMMKLGMEFFSPLE